MKKNDLIMSVLSRLFDKMDDPDLVSCWNSFCDNGNRGDDRIYEMEDLDWLLEGKTPAEVLDSVATEFDSRKSEYIAINGYGYWENVEDPRDEIYTDEMADYVVEYEDDLGNDEIREILDADPVDLFVNWIIERSEDVENRIHKYGDIGGQLEDEARQIAMDWQNWSGFLEDLTDEFPAWSQVADVDEHMRTLASMFNLWDEFEENAITNAPALYSGRGPLYEDWKILVEVTGKSDDFAITITNKTKYPIKIPACYWKEYDEDDNAIEIDADDWIGILAGTAARDAYDYYRAGGGSEGMKAVKNNMTRDMDD